MAFNGQILKKCNHMNQITIHNPAPTKCDKCIELGDSWNHLRTCLICGNVGCCGSSKNKHGELHYKETKHAMFHISESKSKIAYCYLDDVYFKF